MTRSTTHERIRNAVEVFCDALDDAMADAYAAGRVRGDTDAGDLVIEKARREILGEIRAALKAAVACPWCGGAE